jgi:mannan endo-1,4-beta-mannosidase
MKSTFFLSLPALCLIFSACSKGSKPQSTSQQDSVNTNEAYLHVKGSGLTDATGNPVMLRGVNVDTYKEGWVDDVAAVAGAVASTKTNVVRLAWWSHISGSPEPQTGTTYYTPDDLDRAISSFANEGILSIVMLHDLTGKNDPTQFQNIITAFWTDPSVVAVVNKHQAHLVINLANEWGANYNTNQNNYSQTDINTFINTYTSAITAIRNAGIKVPLLIDAYGYADREEIFTSASYGQGTSNGAYLISQDPLHNLLFGLHTYYWENNSQDNTPTIDPTARLQGLVSSGLPFIVGEMGNILPDGSAPTGYADFLTKANSMGIGYVAWAWYNDGTDDQTGTAPYAMNMTINDAPVGDGVTLPSSPSQNSWGYNMLNGAGYGINTASPETKKLTFPH